MGVYHVLNRLVGDVLDVLDQVPRERGDAQRVNHQHAVVTDDDAGVGKAFVQPGEDASFEFYQFGPRCSGHMDWPSFTDLVLAGDVAIENSDAAPQFRLCVGWR